MAASVVVPVSDRQRVDGKSSRLPIRDRYDNKIRILFILIFLLILSKNRGTGACRPTINFNNSVYHFPGGGVGWWL